MITTSDKAHVISSDGHYLVNIALYKMVRSFSDLPRVG